MDRIRKFSVFNKHSKKESSSSSFSGHTSSSSDGNVPPTSRPTYRGTKPLRAADIQLVLDIARPPSPDYVPRPYDSSRDPYYPTSTSYVDATHSERSRTRSEHHVRRQEPYNIDRRILDQFPTPPELPSPPTVRPINAYKRRSRSLNRPMRADNCGYNEDRRVLDQFPTPPSPPTVRPNNAYKRRSRSLNRPMRVDTSGYEAELLPPLPPRIIADFERNRVALMNTEDRWPSSGYPLPPPPPHPHTLPTSKYYTPPTPAEPTAQPPRANTYPPSTSSRTQGSMGSLGRGAQLKSGPAAHRPVVRQASTPIIHHTAQMVSEYIPPVPALPIAYQGNVERRRLYSGPGELVVNEYAEYTHNEPCTLTRSKARTRARR